LEPKSVTRFKEARRDFNELEILVVNRATAAAVIKDLAEDLAGTGTGKLVLQGADGRFLTIQVKDE
jgi:acetylglutamate kinase